MLAKRFEHILHDLGMAGLEHPLFYHAPVGIRFKIGGEEPIYLDRRAAKLKTNPAMFRGRWTEPPRSIGHFRRCRTFCGSTGIPMKNPPSPC